MLMTALLVLGLFSWKNLPIEQFPDVKFPFAIVYLVGTGEIIIFAVAHFKRRPGYWTSRS